MHACSLLGTQVAADAGVRVVLDAGGQEGPLSGALLANISILSPNETELARMTGLPTDSEEQIVQAAQALQALGVSTVLVKLGADGALLVDADGSTTRVPAFVVKQVVDTTGAGDCFTASFCVGLLEGKTYKEAMRFAGMLLMTVVSGDAHAKKVCIRLLCCSNPQPRQQQCVCSARGRYQACPGERSLQVSASSDKHFCTVVLCCCCIIP